MFPHFEDIGAMDIRDSVVVVDIDGTLACSGSDVLTDATRTTLTQLCVHNDVYLFSNSFKYGRNHRLAEALRIPLIQTVFRKPLPWGIRYIKPESLKKSRVVIGDRVLTDGLFARAIGARFVHVARVTCADDSWLTRFVYWTDDIGARLLGFSTTKRNEGVGTS